MSLLLSHLKTYDTKPNSVNKNVQSTKASSETSAADRTNLGKDVVEGEVKKGEVVDLRSNEATIRFSDGTQIQGKIEQDVDLYIGQKANFELSKSGENGIKIKVIPEQNVSESDPLVGKALQQAGLPTTQKNQEIVRALLDANQSVDKKSIQQFLKISYQFPNAEVKDIAFLMKHQIPINEANLNMMKEYESSEHRIVSQAEHMAAEAKSMLSEQTSFETTLKLLEMALDHPEYVKPQTKEAIESISEKQTNQNEQNITNPQETLDTTQTEQANKMMLNSTEIEIAIKNDSQEGAKVETQDITLNAPQMVQSEEVETSLLKQYMPKEQLQELAKEFETANAPKEFIQKLMDGEISKGDVLKQVYQLGSKEFNTSENLSAVQKLLHHDAIKQIFKDELLKNFLLTPKEIEQGENVKKFFHHMEEKLGDLQQLLAKSAQNEASSKLLNQTEHLKQNLDFMKTLNQIYPYIQLPVHFKNQNVHSELYVFKKKQSNRNPNEPISVLLHLDMDRLGALDIHIKMIKKKIQTKYYMEDKDSKEIFEETIEELNHSITKLGYLFESEFFVTEEKKNALDEMIVQEQAAEGMTMKRYTFDIRA